jgi:hypothetical protein
MSQRAAAWLAWSLCALSLALTALSVLLMLVEALLSATSPGPIISLGPIQNPLALVESLPIDYKIVELVVNTLMVVAVISLFIRLRRAGEQERQQIKWFVYAIALAIGGAVLTFPVSEAISSASLKWIGFVPFIVGVVFIPISMGIAIMRYRLYDIDLLINRTLVYGVLTVMLVALYFGSIVVLQRVFVLLTGQQSTLAVVASTLLIAALFNPSRHRYTVVYRPSLLPQDVRRQKDARRVLSETT